MANRTGSRRTKAEMAAFDKFIEENFEKHGADYCARNLGESERYIRARASKLGIHLGRPLTPQQGV